MKLTPRQNDVLVELLDGEWLRRDGDQWRWGHINDVVNTQTVAALLRKGVAIVDQDGDVVAVNFVVLLYLMAFLLVSALVILVYSLSPISVIRISGSVPDICKFVAGVVVPMPIFPILEINIVDVACAIPASLPTIK